MPRLFDCFQMSKHSYTKEEGHDLSKSLRLLSQTDGHTGGGRGGGVRREQTHESGSDLCNARLQCALSTSTALTMEHTTSASTKGVVPVRRGKHGLNPYFFCFHPTVCTGSRVEVSGPGRHFNDEKLIEQ